MILGKGDALRDRVVLITGASSGIGEALGVEAARLGAKLILFARRRERLEAIANSLRARGSLVETVVGDVTELSSLEAASALAANHFGRLDYVIANAGFGVTGAFEKLSAEDFRRQFEINIFGVLNTVRATLPFVRQSRGSLVLMGSVSSYVSTAGDTPYAMSKAAVRALSDSLHLELASSGVAVTLICPGFVESEIRSKNNRGQFKPEAKDPIPSWLVMPKEKAARQIWRGILTRRRELVITKHGKIAVWLRQHVPALLFWIFRKISLGEHRTRIPEKP